ncbi:hypothetical protein QX25_02845 [Stutzerimonas stutzeri]|nr:hypothetical protein QX25_02845 [Stutzerimonas stutzeri]
MSFPKYPEYKDSGVEWFGDVPCDWRVQRLKQVVNPSRPITYGIVQAGENVPDGIPYIRPADMADESGVKTEDALLRTSQEIASAYRRSSISAGDIVCSIGPSFGKLMMVPLSLEGANLTQGTARVAVANEHVPRFIFWVLRSVESYQQWESSVGGATFRALNLGPLAETFLCVPSWAEQTQIARFLDHETARIDALIEEQQRLIELLKEKRQAVISHAVTKGLDPTVPMKDSGVEWLGEVPAHWEVLQFRRGFTFLTDYEANGSFAATKEMVNLDEGEPYAWFVRATDLENGRIGLIQGNRYCDEASYQFLSKTKLDGGELLIAKRGEIGKVYQLPELSCRATLAPNLYSIKLSKKIITQFAFYWFSSSFGRPQLELANKSTTIGALYKDDVRALICIFPPVSEQHEITKRVDEQIRHVDLMIAEAEKIISLSSERRSALISAAVTGKIDVRGWQPPASTQAPESAVAEAN